MIIHTGKEAPAKESREHKRRNSKLQYFVLVYNIIYGGDKYNY